MLFFSFFPSNSNKFWKKEKKVQMPNENNLTSVLWIKAWKPVYLIKNQSCTFSIWNYHKKECHFMKASQCKQVLYQYNSVNVLDIFSMTSQLNNDEVLFNTSKLPMSTNKWLPLKGILGLQQDKVVNCTKNNVLFARLYRKIFLVFIRCFFNE